MLNSRIVLTCLLLLTGSACADDWAADFQGDVKVDAVSRYYRLQTRLFELPEFQRTEYPRYMPESFLKFFVRVLDGDDYDNELHWEAADALERVAREELADPETFLPSLRNRLTQTESKVVKRICARALVAADDRESAAALSKLCQPDEHVLCMAIEPWLAEVEPSLMLDSWMERVREPQSTSQPQVALACRCLTKCGHAAAADILQALVTSDSTTLDVRRSAAIAISRLQPSRAAVTAKLLAGGSLSDRILSAMLLDHADSEDALSLLSTLCDDDEAAIASLAWTSLERLDRSRLENRLSTAANHSEPNVRLAVVSALRHLPSTEHCQLLSRLMADRHIAVRNNARAALHLVAGESSDLRPAILVHAGQILENTEANWQQLEQAMLLLGQQKHSDYQALVSPLLSHERHEVYVTASWLMHMMPKAELSDEVIRMADVRHDFLNGSNFDVPLPIRDAMSIQLKYLFHIAAATRRADIAPIAKKMLDKNAPTLVETRAVGVWALGVVSRGLPTQETVRRSLVARVHDDSEDLPEDILVKSTSALGLGELMMKESIPDLRLAHNKYGISDQLGQCVSHALQMLGEETPTVPELPAIPVGGWKLGPSFRRQ